MGVTIPGVTGSVKPLQLRVGDVGEVHLRLHEGLHHAEEGGIAEAAQLRHVLQEHPSRETEDILRHLARRSPAPASHHNFSTVGGRGGGGRGVVRDPTQISRVRASVGKYSLCLARQCENYFKNSLLSVNIYLKRIGN